MENPVTQAALDYMSDLLEAAEAELAITRRDLEITQRELRYARDELAMVRRQVQLSPRQDSMSTWGHTWNGPINGAMAQVSQVDEAALRLEGSQLREALGIPDTAKLPQDRKRKTK